MVHESKDFRKRYEAIGKAFESMEVLVKDAETLTNVSGMMIHALESLLHECMDEIDLLRSQVREQAEMN